MEHVEMFSGDRASRFDEIIRARIPGYEVALQTATAQIACSRAGGAILSVGCGSGRDVIDLARRPAYHVTAIDPSPDMIALAAARFRSEELAVELRCCTLLDLPDEPRYDAALLCFVLHFIPDDGGKDRLLEQIARRLRPGGELVLLDLCRSGTHARDMAALRVYIDWFSKMSGADIEACMTRVRELPLLDREVYAERAIRAGFASARPFYASLHVGGWILEKAST